LQTPPVISGRAHSVINGVAGSRCGFGHSRRVVAASAFRAGRLATAGFLLGTETGLAFLEGASGVEGTLITEDGAILSTNGGANLSNLPGSVYPACPAL
jgi:hypothetical protein